MGILENPRTAADQVAVEAFRRSFRGELLRPGDTAYEAARKIWNGGIDRRPSLIARCTGTADVVQAVRFARARDLPTSVRGGGPAGAGPGGGGGGGLFRLFLVKGVGGGPAARAARGPGGGL